MPSQTITQTVTSGSDTFQAVYTVTNTQSRAITITLAASTTNHEIDIVLTRAQVKALTLQSNGGDLTIKTNSSGSPADTVVMVSGGLITWDPADGIGTDPFATADVTKLFLTTTAGTIFSLRAIVTDTNG